MNEGIVKELRERKAPRERKRAPKTTGRFARVDEEVLAILAELTHSQCLVWLAIQLHAVPGQECWPSVERLCAMTSLSRRAVQLARAALVDKQLLRVVGRTGKRSVYTVSGNGGDPQIAAIPGSPLPDPAGDKNGNGGDPQIAAIPGSLRSPVYQGGDPQIAPPWQRGRSPDHPEEMKRLNEETPARAIHDGRAAGSSTEPDKPHTTASKKILAGTRRLCQTKASLELLGVPQAELDTINAGLLGLLSADEFSKMLDEAKREKSVMPFLEGRNGGSS